MKSVTISDVDFFFFMYFQTTVADIIPRDPSTFLLVWMPENVSFGTSETCRSQFK